MTGSDPARPEAEELEEFERAMRAAGREIPNIQDWPSVRRSVLADALIPRIVPSIATYGAYEQPVE